MPGFRAPAGGCGHSSMVSPAAFEPGSARSGAAAAKPIAEAPARTKGDFTRSRRERLMEEAPNCALSDVASHATATILAAVRVFSSRPPFQWMLSSTSPSNPPHLPLKDCSRLLRRGRAAVTGAFALINITNGARVVKYENRFHQCPRRFVSMWNVAGGVRFFTCAAILGTGWAGSSISQSRRYAGRGRASGCAAAGLAAHEVFMARRHFHRHFRRRSGQ